MWVENGSFFGAETAAGRAGLGVQRPSLFSAATAYRPCGLEQGINSLWASVSYQAAVLGLCAPLLSFLSHLITALGALLWANGGFLQWSPGCCCLPCQHLGPTQPSLSFGAPVKVNCIPTSPRDRDSAPSLPAVRIGGRVRLR